ncbi:MAG: efflux RND transporter periplasmic adaptor subunit [Gemmatimonadaceae bacterium]|nr:efflux RND transporter periplasmic adaptor subunit [Gemmatimonadaceae bacterium]
MSPRSFHRAVTLRSAAGPRVTALVASSAAVVVGCSSPERAAVPATPVRTVTVGDSTTAPRRAVDRYAGTVVPRIEAAVSFQVPGRIVARLAEVGAPVRAGAPIARLDAGDFALAVASARAAVRAAESDAQTANADLVRARDLHQQRIVPDAALERAEALATAANSRLDDARARLATAQNGAGYTTLIAPAAGVVTAVLAEVGQVVGPGQPVATIARDGGVEVAIDVPEGRILAIRIGDRAEVTGLDDAPTRAPIAATVREVAPAADPATGTYRVRLALVTGARRDLPRLGQSATVTFTRSDAIDGTQLPASALVQRGGRPGVWVLATSRDRVRFRPVDVVRMGDGDIVVRGAFARGEQVVSAGAHRLDSTLVVTPWEGRLP